MAATDATTGTVTWLRIGDQDSRDLPVVTSSGHADTGQLLGGHRARRYPEQRRGRICRVREVRSLVVDDYHHYGQRRAGRYRDVAAVRDNGAELARPSG